MKKDISERRRRRSGGNSLVENVFTLIPTFALIFGFCDVGLMIFRWTTLQNAVREGCRYAVTFQRKTIGGSLQGQDESVKQVVEDYAMGIVTRTATTQRIFVDYYSTATTSAYNTAIPYASGGNVPGNIVEVSVKNLPLAWIAPLSGSLNFGQSMFYTSGNLNLNVFSADVLGGYPVGVTSVPR